MYLGFSDDIVLSTLISWIQMIQINDVNFSLISGAMQI